MQCLQRRDGTWQTLPGAILGNVVAAQRQDRLIRAPGGPTSVGNREALAGSNKFYRESSESKCINRSNDESHACGLLCAVVMGLEEKEA